jgi:hypothetical protein
MKTSTLLPHALPPLSPVGQLLYDIMGIIEAGAQSVADQRRDAVEGLGKADPAELSYPSELSCPDDLSCSLDEATFTVRIAPKRASQV